MVCEAFSMATIILCHTSSQGNGAEHATILKEAIAADFFCGGLSLQS